MAQADGGNDQQLLDAVRAEQVRLLYAGGSGVGPAASLVVAALLSGVLVWQKTLALPVAGLWLAALAIQGAAAFAIGAAFHRADPPASDWRRWARRSVGLNIASGVVWGAGMPFLLPPDRFDLQMLVTATMCTGAYNMIGQTGSYRPAFATFWLPFAPIIGWFLWQGDTLHLVCAASLFLWLPGAAAMGLRHNATLVEALRLRFENAALVGDLTRQKALAEHSDRAKSRFLAAASHDLRQPVHALGMFVGALRALKLPARARVLIDHVDASVGAMDGLFISLLDISRLDAGVVEAAPVPVALQPMLARICRDLAGDAQAKGLTLRSVPTTLAAVSDPVHLERIARNLIGNAVRYTETGGVVVGARRQGATALRPESVRIEVWDSGPGIAEAEREAIFEEFYQLSNPDRDRARGLGLGLAIVRRLTAILGHDLSFQSRPGPGAGSGSVFRVAVDRAAAAPAAAEPPIEAPAPDARPGLILVIDDEQAIRVGMGELLAGWGLRALAAPGGEEAMALLAAEAARPDLIISDYRLRGENGIVVIRRLQAAFGADIPAILLTGDTAADRIREAQASGFPLLHKPVSHVRLRAAVTNLLRRKATTAAE